MTGCPFCLATNVVVLEKTLQGARKLISYRCETCGKGWTEMTSSQLPADHSQDSKRDTGTK